MRLPRIYCQQALGEGREIELSGETVHYLRNVLRLQQGQDILVFNGADGEYSAHISSLGKNQILILPGEQVRPVTDAALQIALGLALSKGDRMDYGLQKSTELGVSEITPLRCEFCEAKLKPERQENRMKHWQRLLVSATEQSERLDLPRLQQPATFSDWIGEDSSCTRLLFHPGGKDELPRSINDKRLRVCIGPEGGFAESEVELARDRGYLVCGLGPRTLRTETAPVVALSILQYRYGDLA